jgi:hypothetical protein
LGFDPSRLNRIELDPTKVPLPFPWKMCSTTLRQGCYTISFVPNGASLFSTRYRGTLRVESFPGGVRMSGDLYTYRLLNDLILEQPVQIFERPVFDRADLASDVATDGGGTIPIYRRRSYHSYLEGTDAKLFKLVPKGTDCCKFTLYFDEFVYNHPATGFSGSFANAPTRSVRWVMEKTSTPHLYTGGAYVGNTYIGSVSIRWVTPHYRRAHLRVHRLDGADTPDPVGTTHFRSIFGDVGWDLSVSDGGTISLPASLAGIDINACWSRANLHTLMASVAGYDPAELDSVWRVHMVAVPATMNCGRGVMFDSSSGADPNSVPREGTATFSHDGYPTTDAPDGMGGSHFDGATDEQQRNVPRAFLRSAAHEVGHAFNQIHQSFEGGNDNSIMTTTPSVATVLGTAGTFPDDINLAFNDTVKQHLRHLPDPAVRPGAMDFFGFAVNAPEAADVAWLETADVTIDLTSDRIHLGQPIRATFTLVNTGEAAIPVPATLDLESLTVRLSVTAPNGEITFLRPSEIHACPRVGIKRLEPGEKVSGSATLFWGREGFAFESPGRHVVEAIVLWELAAVPVGASGTREVFVRYPISGDDNEVAALLLHPDVGRAVGAGTLVGFEGAKERIERAVKTAKSHPAVKALLELGLEEERKRAGRRAIRSKKPTAKSDSKAPAKPKSKGGRGRGGGRRKKE